MTEATRQKAIVARVAFPVRAHTLFDYHLPPDSPPAVVGRRVLAPFGQKQAVGVIMETADSSTVPANKLKTLARIFDDMPPLPSNTLAQIRFCAEYYHCPIGIAAAAALPLFFRRSNHYRPPSGYQLADTPDNTAPFPARSAKAAALVELLRARGALSLAEIQQQVANPSAMLRRLVTGGHIVRCHLWEKTPPPAAAETPPPLTAAQQQAMAALKLQDGFVPHLLLGKTGSGKTEIYLRAVEAVLAKQQQALILTPEIHLTPQLQEHFSRRFPNRQLCVLHSNLADGERAERWLMARKGFADIVLGTRLAVFTPMPRLGLIVIDEEHDDSFKQEEGLLFSARDTAIWRAKNENIPLLSGSATPSLESYHNAGQRRWQLLRMDKRIIGTAVQVQTVEASGDNYHGMSNDFLLALRDCLKGGGQALVFINRRGYAPILECRSCRQVCRCRRCSVNMTVHRRRDVLCCHLCGWTAVIPTACESCGAPMSAFGTGTQRVEEALARLFPETPMVRLDSDSMKGGRFAKARAQIADGTVRLLVGTKIIAKGHDFPHLSLVGILNADQGLLVADFRAEERLFALLSQVLGRGTRNPKGCRVVIQTHHPNHPFYADIAADNVDDCWRRLLKERQRAQLPPFAYLALLRGKAQSPQRLEKFMREALVQARERAPAAVRVFDSVPPAIEKVGNWHRRQALIHTTQRRALHDFLRAWMPHIPSSCHWQIDVDPMVI